LQEGKAG